MVKINDERGFGIKRVADCKPGSIIECTLGVCMITDQHAGSDTIVIVRLSDGNHFTCRLDSNIKELDCTITITN